VLQALVLSENRIGRVGAASIAALALPRLTSLAELALSDNRLDSPGLHAVAEAIGAGCTPSLRRLLLGRVGADAAAASALAAALGKVPGLEELVLSHNDVRDEGASSIAAALAASCPRLEKLDLVSCGLGNAGARALAGALSRAPLLTRLGLRGNEIGDGARVELREAAAHKAELQGFF
jgi:Ran GTPase-activating protein (RanGAP) involved in mRNA processing and transport